MILIEVKTLYVILLKSMASWQFQKVKDKTYSEKRCHHVNSRFELYERQKWNGNIWILLQNHFQTKWLYINIPRLLYIYMNRDDIIGDKEERLPGYIYMSSVNK